MKVAEIIEALGGSALAMERLGVKRTTLAMWRKRGRVPPRRVPAVARALGVAAEIVWPELATPPAGGAASLSTGRVAGEIKSPASTQGLAA